MGFRIFRRLKIAPGVTINLSKSGLSTSFGPKGAKVTVGRRGVRGTVGLPGTGLSYTETSHPGRRSGKTQAPGGRSQSGTETTSAGREPNVAEMTPEELDEVLARSLGPRTEGSFGFELSNADFATQARTGTFTVFADVTNESGAPVDFFEVEVAIAWTDHIIRRKRVVPGVESGGMTRFRVFFQQGEWSAAGGVARAGARIRGSMRGGVWTRLEAPEVNVTKASDTKVCPRCAETIKAAALVCRYCRHEFAGS